MSLSRIAGGNAGLHLLTPNGLDIADTDRPATTFNQSASNSFNSFLVFGSVCHRKKLVRAGRVATTARNLSSDNACSSLRFAVPSTSKW